MSDSQSDKALAEFLSEAQEIVEKLSRDLLILDEGRAAGRYDPEALNDAFRAVHSFKGLSGLFGVTRMTSLSHNLENLLDSLRLGKVDLSPSTLDLLFEAVTLYGRIITETSAGTAIEGDGGVNAYMSRLDNAVHKREPQPETTPWGGYDLDPGMLSVLTEYEEHRLRENIKAGRALYRIHAAFDLMTIDKGLDELKSRLKPVGEVITYLPSTEAANDQQIELDVILGASRPHVEVVTALAGSSAVLAELPRKAAAQRVAAPPPSRRASQVVAADDPPLTPLAPQSDEASAPPSRSGIALPDEAVIATAGSTGAQELSLKSVAQTVRVDIRKLDTLMNVVGELQITRAGLYAVLDRLRGNREMLPLWRSLHHELRGLTRRLDELQAGILEVRMVPLGQVFDKLSRVVRKISRDAGKEIRLVISGADTELDKLIVEELSDPLMHVIRNCIDHGIEPKERRRALGKPEAGTISIWAEQRGNHVVLTIEDDGAGLDQRKILQKAIARGAIDPAVAAELSEREVMNLIFLPGVSTKDVADQMSGRGVGMDVVKTNIARLSGIIDIESEESQGTRMSITLPITLAIIQALVIKAAGRTFAIPLNSVLESLTASANEISTIEGREVMSVRGQTMPLLRLERLFELERTDLEPPPHRQFVVVVGMAQHRIGLCVDELQGQQDIVIKSLGPTLDGAPGIAGATELGGQRTVLVLDVAAIVEEAVGQAQVEAA